MQGNHDIDSCDDKRRWNSVSRDAYAGLKYSNSLLSEDHKEWLRSLHIEQLVQNKEMPFWISHYSPKMCTRYGYILNQFEAGCGLKALKKMTGANIFFFGHTHVPTFIEENERGKIVFDMGRHLEGDTNVIDPDSYYLINPGSIGQPRSGITSYAILDTEEKTVAMRGLDYDFKAAMKDAEDANYSLSIPRRLDADYDPYKAGKQAKKERCKKAQQAKKKSQE
jgi:diadenosine tetraphosphatase ApaH/serine/threonine PP2A family protein phosphatase